MNGSYQQSIGYPQFNQYQQWAEINPENKNEFRTFFLKKNHISRKDEIIGLTPFVPGTPPNHIRVIHPHRMMKIRAGNSY